jgi:hypothetical protein
MLAPILEMCDTPIRWWRRRWWRRLCMASVTVPAALAVIWWSFVQGRYLWWQRNCLRYSPPADQLVYDDHPPDAWLETSQSVGDFPLYSQLPQSPFSGRLDPAFLPTARRATPVLRESPDSHRLRLWFGAIFLHRRRDRVGVERLVQISASDYEVRRDTYALILSATTSRPASAFPGSAMADFDFPPVAIVVPDGKRLQIFAGQPDPADESRFTFAYSLGGVPGVVGGVFHDETDSGLRLTVESGPAELAQPYRSLSAP